MFREFKHFQFNTTAPIPAAPRPRRTPPVSTGLALLLTTLAAPAQAATLTATPLTTPPGFFPTLLADNGTLFGMTGPDDSGAPAQFAAGKLSFFKSLPCTQSGGEPPQASTGLLGVLASGQAAILQSCTQQSGLDYSSVEMAFLATPRGITNIQTVGGSQNQDGATTYTAGPFAIDRRGNFEGEAISGFGTGFTVAFSNGSIKLGATPPQIPIACPNSSLGNNHYNPSTFDIRGINGTEVFGGCTNALAESENRTETGLICGLKGCKNFTLPFSLTGHQIPATTVTTAVNPGLAVGIAIAGATIYPWAFAKGAFTQALPPLSQPSYVSQLVVAGPFLTPKNNIVAANGDGFNTTILLRTANGLTTLALPATPYRAFGVNISVNATSNLLVNVFNGANVSNFLVTCTGSDC